MSSRLLYNEAPLCLSPTLAKYLGLKESIVLQQIHYFIEANRSANRNYQDGRYWTYSSYPEWQRNCFPFMSISTIKRIIRGFEKDGILVSFCPNKSGFDQRKWYSIDYDKLDERIKQEEEKDNQKSNIPEKAEENMEFGAENTDRGGQFDPTPVQAEPPYNINNNIDSITKIYTKNQLNVLNGTSCDKHKDVRCGDKPFDPMILKRQVIGCCHDIGIMDVTEIDTLFKVIRCYYAKYRSTFMEEHPRLSTYAMKRVIDELRDKLTGYEPNELCELIDQHFNTVYGGMGTDYNLCHFCSGEIMQNRSYETFGV